MTKKKSHIVNRKEQKNSLNDKNYEDKDSEYVVEEKYNYKKFKGSKTPRAIIEQETDKIIENNKKLLSIIAHDIKSPFGTMIGFLNLIKDGIHTMSKDDIAQKVEYALLSALQTHSLLDSLLEWAYAYEKAKGFNPELASVKELLSEEIENMQLITSQKNITITTSDIYSKNLFLDKNMIKTVLRNLLYNAVKYSFNGGIIAAKSIEKHDFLEISIKDSGMGMSQEQKKKIFSNEGFISTTGTNNESGTGYGLLLCEEFINSHGGKIWVVIDNVQGSEIKFTLPITETT